MNEDHYATNKIESDKKKISVSMKNLTEDPYEKIINKYDSNTHYTYLDEIKDGLKFKYENNRIYQKIKKRRKRYLCLDTEDRRKYLFRSF